MEHQIHGNILQVPNTDGVTVLAPGPSMMEKSKGTKRKNSESGKEDGLSMADRLKLLSNDSSKSLQSSTPPRTDSVLQLLLQGLNNQDRKNIESVLERADDELINNTIKRLPLEAIVPLLEELRHYMHVSFYSAEILDFLPL